MIFRHPTFIVSTIRRTDARAGRCHCDRYALRGRLRHDPPQYLKGGDEMVARIDRIGELRNRVVEV